ncbi:6921_t:CDS:1 [Funneliformis geosporum]|uniref:6857_t:CDS:1 n=1 Tax=Funneliformis geosporum TaxID=1117311 RepID=A0A9W4WI54_9GLOM|nr:6921_t:CDS:1 [Funneliformis geosporum]CAI2163559.1 6857_t:CDS:1 [Funneliformis geosporum]
MQSQQVRNKILSIRSTLNYNRIYTPTRDELQLIAAQTKDKLTGLSFLNLSIRFETNRLHLYDTSIIDSLSDQLWDSSTSYQQEQWTAYANDVNEINLSILRANEDLLKRISGLTEPQIVNSDFEQNFFFGVSFP